MKKVLSIILAGLLGIQPVFAQAITKEARSEQAITLEQWVKEHSKEKKRMDRETKKSFPESVKKVGQCMLIVGVELAIVILIIYIIRRLSQIPKERALKEKRTAFCEKLSEAIDKATAQTINYKNNAGLTLLMLAVRNCEHNLVQKAIDKGADLDTQDQKGYTAVKHAIDGAITTKDFSMLKFLLDKKPNLTLKGERSEGSYGGKSVPFYWDVKLTPLALVTLEDIPDKQKMQLVSFLLNNGVKVDTGALAGAIVRGNLALVKLLLEKAEKDLVNQNTYDGHSLLYHAISRGAHEPKAMVQLLLDHGANKAGRDAEGKTVYDHLSNKTSDIGLLLKP